MKNLFILGTRPEAIKLAPLINEFKKHREFSVDVCVTAQHRQMLDQILTFFEIQPQYDLNLMKPNQSLFEIMADGMKGIEKVLDTSKPDLVFVQGDTTTALIGAMAAFYKKKPVAHIEAGLRSGNIYSPFPEEMNRLLISSLTKYNFVPTEQARINLEEEKTRGEIYNVGNTVIDALFLGLDKIKKGQGFEEDEIFQNIDFSKKIILITGHRRESFGEPFKDICNALKEVAEKYPDIQMVYPVHFNPNVRETVGNVLKGIINIHLIDPLDYPKFIWLMNQSHIIVTDSGGVQEEGPSLGKPVVVMRDVTERTEGIKAGTAILVGTSKERIVTTISSLIEDEKMYSQMSRANNPYGDGNSSKRITEIIFNNFIK